MHPITQGFGYDPTYEGNNEHFHYGLDFGLPPGIPVLAVADGQVVEAAPELPKRYPSVLDGAWGTYVEIKHDDGLHSGYAHLSALRVVVTQEVSAGQLLGYSGATGRKGYITGPHLHFQAFKGGKRIDPAPLLGV